METLEPAKVYRAFNLLPDDERAVVEKASNGYDTRQIATALKLRRAKVEERLARGLRLIRSSLGLRDIDDATLLDLIVAGKMAEGMKDDPADS